MTISVTLNGQAREISDAAGGSMAELLQELGFKPDRVAVEQNGAIVSRKHWATTTVADGDRLEIVHFVGGGVGTPVRARRSASQRSPYSFHPPSA